MSRKMLDSLICDELIFELLAIKQIMNQDNWPKQPRLVDFVETRIKDLKKQRKELEKT